MPEPALPSSSSPRSTAQQVTYWLILASLVVAVVVMGFWWLAEGISVTPSTTFIFAFATGGLWVTIYHLLILVIRQLVRNRVAESDRGST